MHCLDKVILTATFWPQRKPANNKIPYDAFESFIGMYLQKGNSITIIWYKLYRLILQYCIKIMLFTPEYQHYNDPQKDHYFSDNKEKCKSMITNIVLK